MQTSLVQNNVEDKTAITSYPCLGLYEKHKDFVVLFHAPKCGTVVFVQDGCIAWKVGDYTDKWGMQYFIPLSEEHSIKLSN